MIRHAAVAATLAVTFALSACGGGDPSDSERERAIDAAMAAYDEAKANGMDLDAGPCISERLPGVDGWVADVAHDPRTAADDDPTNQCQSYIDGEASHFVELTPDGELIRAE